MLRRRILASAMASVMAIGSVAVVANAETTAAATTQAKTKADLEAYAKGFESFISTKLDDYGSVSGENFLNAFEYAQNVLADSKASLDDYTVAYAMLEATYNKLKIYTVEELKALLESSKATYETNNIYNEELDDLRYTPASWGAFEEAYDDADAVIGSSDSRIITDAYETLEAAVSNLSALSNVTKAQFRTTLKAYETILQKEYAYDSWRVGTISGWADIREMFNDKDGVNSGHFGSWGFYGQSVTYGSLYQWANTFAEMISEGYKKLDGIKAVNRTSDNDIVTAFKVAQDIVDVFSAYTPDDSARGSKATVTKLISKYQGRLVHDYETTAAEKLYEKVVDAVGAANLHNRLGNDYYSKIDKDLPAVAAGADAWYVPKALWNEDNGIYKDVDAMLSIKTDVTFYLIFDDDKNVVDVTTTKPASNVSSKTINRNTEVDLTDYIVIDPDNIKAEFSAVDNHNINGINDGDAYGKDKGTWSGFQNWASNYSYGTKLFGEAGLPGGAFGGDYINSSGVPVSSYANLALAMDIATTYLGGDKTEIAESAIYDIDTTDSIAAGTAKGSSSEWTLVYRYLKYALSDKYDVAVGTHTKADVEALIDKCYELAELTGDAAIFTVNHKALVDARQDALTWVKAANKDSAYYKDNTVPYLIADSNGKISGYKVADQVYNKLEDYYNDLEADYNAFKYSFGEIYNKIADVKAAIDDGDLQGTEALITALENTAYRLSVVQAITLDASGNTIEIDNDAFTTDRYANLFNRVYTYTDPDWGYDLKLPTTPVSTVKLPPYKSNGEVTSHANLVEAYEALLAEVKAQTEVKTVVGDVNGDGVVNALDAAAILKAVAAGTTIDVAVGDYNADGNVNALDAAAILKAATQA